MTDRTTKILLTVIALGIWANALPPAYNLAVQLVNPRASGLGALQQTAVNLNAIFQANFEATQHLKDIRQEMVEIGTGYCSNKKLCERN